MFEDDINLAEYCGDEYRSFVHYAKHGIWDAAAALISPFEDEQWLIAHPAIREFAAYAADFDWMNGCINL